ncbi:hypothetical protein CDAR_549311 [Caerostris darwini]|uniref:Uncharacterized protein n=1 Tax=Caerostris darwini TaxID=1538125 RepID=A0AAV4X6L8_9ARAC|nr:hypothetical protein CDAR_549311 [Caerostris darwini]
MDLNNRQRTSLLPHAVNFGSINDPNNFINKNTQNSMQLNFQSQIYPVQYPINVGSINDPNNFINKNTQNSMQLNFQSQIHPVQYSINVGSINDPNNFITKNTQNSMQSNFQSQIHPVQYPINVGSFNDPNELINQSKGNLNQLFFHNPFNGYINNPFNDSNNFMNQNKEMFQLSTIHGTENLQVHSIQTMNINGESFNDSNGFLNQRNYNEGNFKFPPFHGPRNPKTIRPFRRAGSFNRTNSFFNQNRRNSRHPIFHSSGSFSEINNKKFVHNKPSYQCSEKSKKIFSSHISPATSKPMPELVNHKTSESDASYCHEKNEHSITIPKNDSKLSHDSSPVSIADENNFSLGKQKQSNDETNSLIEEQSIPLIEKKPEPSFKLVSPLNKYDNSQCLSTTSLITNISPSNCTMNEHSCTKLSKQKSLTNELESSVSQCNNYSSTIYAKECDTDASAMKMDGTDGILFSSNRSSIPYRSAHNIKNLCITHFNVSPNENVKDDQDKSIVRLSSSEIKRLNEKFRKFQAKKKNILDFKTDCVKAKHIRKHKQCDKSIPRSAKSHQIDSLKIHFKNLLELKSKSELIKKDAYCDKSSRIFENHQNISPKSHRNKSYETNFSIAKKNIVVKRNITKALSFLNKINVSYQNLKSSEVFLKLEHELCSKYNASIMFVILEKKLIKAVSYKGILKILNHNPFVRLSNNNYTKDLQSCWKKFFVKLFELYHSKNCIKAQKSLTVPIYMKDKILNKNDYDEISIPSHLTTAQDSILQTVCIKSNLNMTAGKSVESNETVFNTLDVKNSHGKENNLEYNNIEIDHEDNYNPEIINSHSAFIETNEKMLSSDEYFRDTTMLDSFCLKESHMRNYTKKEEYDIEMVDDYNPSPKEIQERIHNVKENNLEYSNIDTDNEYINIEMNHNDNYNPEIINLRSESNKTNENMSNTDDYDMNSTISHSFCLKESQMRNFNEKEENNNMVDGDYNLYPQERIHNVKENNYEYSNIDTNNEYTNIEMDHHDNYNPEMTNLRSACIKTNEDMSSTNDYDMNTTIPHSFSLKESQMRNNKNEENNIMAIDDYNTCPEEIYIVKENNFKYSNKLEYYDTDNEYTNVEMDHNDNCNPEITNLKTACIETNEILSSTDENDTNTMLDSFYLKESPVINYKKNEEYSCIEMVDDNYKPCLKESIHNVKENNLEYTNEMEYFDTAREYINTQMCYSDNYNPDITNQESTCIKTNKNMSNTDDYDKNTTISHSFCLKEGQTRNLKGKKADDDYNLCPQEIHNNVKENNLKSTIKMEYFDTDSEYTNVEIDFGDNYNQVIANPKLVCIETNKNISSTDKYDINTTMLDSYEYELDTALLDSFSLKESQMRNYIKKEECDIEVEHNNFNILEDKFVRDLYECNMTDSDSSCSKEIQETIHNAKGNNLEYTNEIDYYDTDSESTVIYDYTKYYSPELIKTDENITINSFEKSTSGVDTLSLKACQTRSKEKMDLSFLIDAAFQDIDLFKENGILYKYYKHLEVTGHKFNLKDIDLNKIELNEEKLASYKFLKKELNHHRNVLEDLIHKVCKPYSSPDNTQIHNIVAEIEYIRGYSLACNAALL